MSNNIEIEYEIQAHDAELRALLKSIKKRIPPCREVSIASTKLEEASMWLCKLHESYIKQEEKDGKENG